VPIVLVHGNGESHDLFETQIKQLVDKGYHVYAPDSRGHGANTPEKEYHYADMAEDMYQFIKSLGLEKPAFYGFSDGGIIGLLLEISHPGTLGILAVSGANLSPAGLSKDFVETYAEINKAVPDPLITLMLTEPDIEPKSLESISIPVLVTAGEHDLILPAETKCIADHLKNVKLVILDGEDHVSYIENSEKMGKLLIDFLESHKYDSRMKAEE
jgi:pimeloyl-ACP methyl ester carboxylesterase